MADWTFATGDALTRKDWAKKWWIEARTESFFVENGYVGMNEESDFIVEIPNLEKDQGDKVTYGQVRELGGAGVSDDSIMEGNEEEPSQYDDDVTLSMKRNAVRLAGMMSGQRPSDKDLRGKAKTLLTRWMAETIDQDIFTALATSLTKNIWGGDATATTDIEAGDYMTLSLISKAAAYAEKASPKIIGKPMNGERMWVCVMSPDQGFDVMERDASWAQAQREAMQRGRDNPLFKNALGIWRNTVLHKHTRVPLSTTWGSGADLPGATALFMGVGAGVIAYANRRIWNEKTFDYSNKVGFCIGAIYGVSKSVFNSADNAVVGINTYRTNN